MLMPLVVLVCQHNVLYCTALYCTLLYCTVLYCTILYCTVLYCCCRCARSSRARCTSPRPRCPRWRLRGTTGWCRCRRVAATTASVTPTTPPWQSCGSWCGTSSPGRSPPAPSPPTAAGRRSGTSSHPSWTRATPRGPGRVNTQLQGEWS